MMSWKVNIAEVGKPGRITTGLPSHTARHNGLPGFSATPWAMIPGAPEPRDDAMGEIAGTFRGAAGQHQHVAVAERIAHGGFEQRLIIGDGADETCVAAVLGDRRGDDGAVGIVDRSRAAAAGLAAPVRRRWRSPRRAVGAPPTRRRYRTRPACRSRASRAACPRAAASRRGRCRSRHRTRTGRARRRGGSAMAPAPSGWVCSTMTMASAPRGTGPPVAIGVAVPGITGSSGATPQAITSSLSATRTGALSPAAARSAARTAKPSTLERSNGGTSMGAMTSSASARPSASASTLRSRGMARGNNAASKRAMACSRDRMVRNWS